MDFTIWLVCCWFITPCLTPPFPTPHCYHPLHFWLPCYLQVAFPLVATTLFTPAGPSPACNSDAHPLPRGYRPCPDIPPATTPAPRTVAFRFEVRLHPPFNAGTTLFCGGHLFVTAPCCWFVTFLPRDVPVPASVRREQHHHGLVWFCAGEHLRRWTTGRYIHPRTPNTLPRPLCHTGLGIWRCNTLPRYAQLFFLPTSRHTPAFPVHVIYPCGRLPILQLRALLPDIPPGRCIWTGPTLLPLPLLYTTCVCMLYYY